MNRELFVLVSASAIALGLASAACSSSSTTTNNTGTDSGVHTNPATDDSGAGDTDGGGDADGGGDTDSGTLADGGFNGCTAYVDNTGKAEVDLVWDTSVANLPDHCSKIKVGSSAKFTGSFSAHPLEALGGDTPTPFTGATADGGSTVVKFTAAGTYGYHCVNHSVMVGAFVVVP